MAAEVQTLIVNSTAAGYFYRPDLTVFASVHYYEGLDRL